MRKIAHVVVKLTSTQRRTVPSSGRAFSTPPKAYVEPQHESATDLGTCHSSWAGSSHHFCPCFSHCILRFNKRAHSLCMLFAPERLLHPVRHSRRGEFKSSCHARAGTRKHVHRCRLCWPPPAPVLRAGDYFEGYLIVKTVVRLNRLSDSSSHLRCAAKRVDEPTSCGAVPVRGGQRRR